MSWGDSTINHRRTVYEGTSPSTNMYSVSKVFRNLLVSYRNQLYDRLKSLRIRLTETKDS